MLRRKFIRDDVTYKEIMSRVGDGETRGWFRGHIELRKYKQTQHMGHTRCLSTLFILFLTILKVNSVSWW